MLKRIALLSLLLPAHLYAHSFQPLDKVVAIVNDDVVTESELNTEVELLRKQLIARQAEVPSDKVLRKQILEHLIDVDLQLQIAKRNDMVVSDQELDEAIGRIAQSNHLSPEELKQAIVTQGLSWQSYRKNIRREILINHIQQKAIGKDIHVSNKQIDDYLKSSTYEKRRQATYHVLNIVVPLSEHPTAQEISKATAKAKALLPKVIKDEDLASLAVIESNDEFPLESSDLGERHLTELPELFAKEVVNMQAGQVVGPIRAGNGLQLIKLASIGGSQEEHKVIKTHVRHILVKPDSSVSANNVEGHIRNIYQQIKSGKDFSAMAKIYSVDAVSAANGGDLGWVDSEELVPEFAQAMEKLPIHHLSQPVKSQFGWHLIEVLERKTVNDPAVYEKQQARHLLTQKKFAEVAQNWVHQLRSDAYIKIMEKDLA